MRHRRRPPAVAATLASAAAAAALAVTPTATAATVSGALDGSYGRCGTLTPPATAAAASPAGLATPSDGSILAVGQRDAAVVTTKLTPAGQIDTTFGTSGTVTSAKLTGPTNPVYGFDTIAQQADGRILLAGGVDGSDVENQAVVARINADGSLDTTFGTGGSVRGLLPPDTYSDLAAIDVDSAGRIIVVGEREKSPTTDDSEFVVVRLTPEGAPDPSFGTAGVVTLAFPGTETATGGAVRALAGGGVLVGGQADEQFALARLRGDGTPDPSFGSAGLVLESPPASAEVRAVEVLPDGRVLAAGAGEDINGDEQVVGRYLPDGKVDTTFGIDGFAVTGGGLDTAGEIIVGTDGSLLVPGRGLARYTPDGMLDPSFGDGGLVSGFGARDVAIGADGSALGSGTAGQAATGFTRHVLGGAALDAVADQNALCRPTIGTSRVRQLVRGREGAPRGALTVRFTLLQPTTSTWAATVQAGKRRLRIGPTEDELVGTYRQSIVIPLTRRQQKQLTGAKSARVTATGRDGDGHEVTVTRTIGR